jgi:hypothetical protein
MSITNSNSLNNALNAIRNMNEEFANYTILGFTIIILILFIGYIIYIRKLESKECAFMDSLYPSIDGHIKSINLADSDCSGNLYDYYIKTAYNACSGGSYKNDFVDICNLKAVLKQGVRCLDFEIYNINNTPVVSTSTTDSYFIKETYNYVTFSDVMKIINSYAFSGGNVPNPNDPLIIHLRIKSTNQTMYTNLANIFKSYTNIMLGKDYSYENSGHNIGNQPLVNFMGKVILIVDKNNNSYLENKDLLEYINLTSNSIFMRGYKYYDVKNTPDINELQEYNKKCMTIVFPDSGINPPNPSGILCRETGCQMVAMRYQYVDNNLEENALFFDNCGYAFCLKPARLRYSLVTIPDPTPQNPAYSYATRNVTTDYYSFNF